MLKKSFTEVASRLPLLPPSLPPLPPSAHNVSITFKVSPLPYLPRLSVPSACCTHPQGRVTNPSEMLYSEFPPCVYL